MKNKIKEIISNKFNIDNGLADNIAKTVLSRVDEKDFNLHIENWNHYSDEEKQSVGIELFGRFYLSYGLIILNELSK